MRWPWDTPRSTLSTGMLRIAFVLLCWTEFAGDLVPLKPLTVDHLALSAAFWSTTTWMLVGWWGRLGTVACALVLGSMAFVLGANGYHEEWGHHHTTLLATIGVYLALAPNSASLSVDRWLELRRSGGTAAPARGHTVGLGLIALQLSTVYFWGAFDKCHLAFLDGTRLTQIFLDTWWSADWWFPPWATALAAASAIAVTVLEFALAFGLWVPAARRWLVPIGIALHAAFYLLLPVGTFSLAVIVFYLAYLDPDEVEAFLRRMLGAAPAA